MVGHNSLELTEGERRATFMGHFNAILAQRARVDLEKAAEKTLRKRAKAEGIALREIDFALRANAMEDDSLIPAELVRMTEIAAWMGLPVGAAPEFDFEREPSVDKAKREGAAAGYADTDGSRRMPPTHAPDSRAGQAYIKAYDAARAQFLADLESAGIKRKAAQPNGEADEEEIDEPPED